MAATIRIAITLMVHPAVLIAATAPTDVEISASISQPPSSTAPDHSDPGLAGHCPLPATHGVVIEQPAADAARAG
jgi:hypothetical protein